MVFYDLINKKWKRKWKRKWKNKKKIIIMIF